MRIASLQQLSIKTCYLSTIGTSQKRHSKIISKTVFFFSKISWSTLSNVFLDIRERHRRTALCIVLQECNQKQKRQLYLMSEFFWTLSEISLINHICQEIPILDITTDLFKESHRYRQSRYRTVVVQIFSISFFKYWCNSLLLPRKWEITCTQWKTENMSQAFKNISRGNQLN